MRGVSSGVGNKEKVNADRIDYSDYREVNPLVKYEAINKKYNLGKLLLAYGCKIDGSNMYCPFHPDEMTGKPSAKYHSDTDLVFCFSESKSYSAYHALKLLYGYDMNKVFKDVWNNMSAKEKEDILGKYKEECNEDEISSEWRKYSVVYKKFSKGEVNFKQHKTCIYRILNMISEKK